MVYPLLDNVIQCSLTLIHVVVGPSTLRMHYWCTSMGNSNWDQSWKLQCPMEIHDIELCIKLCLLGSNCHGMGSVHKVI